MTGGCKVVNGVEGLTVRLTRSLRGCEETGLEGVMEEGVTETSLICHEEGVSETDPVEIVGIRVDPVRFVKEREEVPVPSCRERLEGHVRYVDSSTLDFSLSSHRPSFISLIFTSRFLDS
jgi:hypothetical protein